MAPVSRADVWRLASRYGLAAFSLIVFPSFVLIRHYVSTRPNILYVLLVLGIALTPTAPVNEVVWLFARRNMLLKPGTYDESVKKRLWWSWFTSLLGLLMMSVCLAVLFEPRQPWAWMLAACLILSAGGVWLWRRPISASEQRRSPH